MDVGDIADISEVHNASILNVDLCKVASFCMLKKIIFQKRAFGGGRVDFDVSSKVLYTQELNYPAHFDP
jgi:hypothetical protein